MKRGLSGRRNHQAGTRKNEGELFSFFNKANKGSQYMIMLSLPLPLSALSSFFSSYSPPLYFRCWNFLMAHGTHQTGFCPGAFAPAVPAALRTLSPESLWANSLIQDWSLFPSHLLNAAPRYPRTPDPLTLLLFLLFYSAYHLPTCHLVYFLLCCC